MLAAVAVRSCEHFHTELESELGRSGTAAERLAGIARAYVRFAGRQRPLFEVLFSAGLDKSQHPEVAAAEKPLDDAFYASIGSLADGDVAREELAIAVEAAAHGYAMLLLDGSFDPSDDAIEAAAARAGRAVSALVESRRLLVRVNV